MTVAFQRMFGILERWNNNQVTPSLGKPHELSYRSIHIYFNKNRKLNLSSLLSVIKSRILDQGLYSRNGEDDFRMRIDSSISLLLTSF